MGADGIDTYAPDEAYCRQPRHSGLVVMERRLQTLSDWTVPAGHGDACTLGYGALVFTSRALRAGGGTPSGLVRVQFTIRGFHGRGRYHVDGPHALRQNVRVTTIGPNGTRAAYSGSIDVHATGPGVSGRIRAEFAQHRTRTADRVYGSWWCATSPPG
jgi:hypothetical protein